jgi:GntR family transcriptional regulator
VTIAVPVDLSLQATDRRSGTALHEQVAAQIRRAIIDGEAKPGERIQKAQDLAAVLGVNTNTVLRALRTLQDEGLLELRRRRGITVAATPDHSELVEQAHTLLSTGKQLGYSPREIAGLLTELATG